MTELYHLVVRPAEGHYNDEWFTTVLGVVRRYSSKFICAEESGDHPEPNHIDCALWMDPADVSAMAKAYQRATAHFPAESKSNHTKHMKKNANAEKYASKEVHRKVYEGYTDTDILEFAAKYREETDQANANYPFKCLARKMAIGVIDGWEDWESILDRSVPVIAAQLLYENLLTLKEYNRAVKHSTLVKLNIADMKKKFTDRCQEIISEIRKQHEERVMAETLEFDRQQDIARKEWFEKAANRPKRKVLNFYIPHGNPPFVDERKVQEEAATRLAELKAEDIL